jgi:3',5'-cyclic AMP phosphodiesterase CpdA
LTTLAHITDLHFGKHEPQIVRALGDDLRSLKLDALVVGGDLTQRAKHEQFRQAKAFLDSIQCTKLVVPGNHDVPALWDVFRRMAGPFRRFHRYFPKDRVQFFENADVCVACINTARRFSKRVDGFWKDGKLRSSDLTIACTRFATSKARVKIVATHHPFVTPDGAFGGNALRHAKKAVEPLTTCGVTVVLGGHLHHAYAVKMSPQLLSVQASTACSTRTRQHPCGYTVIRISSAVEIAKRVWDGQRFVESLVVP